MFYKKSCFHDLSYYKLILIIHYNITFMLGQYKVIIDKNHLKLIRTDDLFQNHEMHSFIVANS